MITDATLEQATVAQRAIGQAEEHLRDLIIAFDDEAREGPRLFTITPIGATLTHPEWTKQRVRLTLWCEHSRVPINTLNGPAGPSGIYDIDIPREWLIKAAPWIKAVTTVIRSLLPVSLAEIKLDLTDKQWKNIADQIEFSEKAIGALATTADSLTPNITTSADLVPAQAQQPTRPEGGLLRTVHALLKQKDPSYARMERVRDRNRYLWVHSKFAAQYQSTIPHIPNSP